MASAGEIRVTIDGDNLRRMFRVWAEHAARTLEERADAIEATDPSMHEHAAGLRDAADIIDGLDSVPTSVPTRERHA